jgi:hypothetical protein
MHDDDRTPSGRSGRTETIGERRTPSDRSETIGSEMIRTGSLPSKTTKTVPKNVSPFLLVAPAGLIALLLVFAIAEDGAFDLRYWAPLALFVLIILLPMLIGGGLRFPRTRPLIVALAAIWGFTAWTLLSAAWAQSAANAWEGGTRTLLYAALFTVGLTALPDRRLRS